MSKRIEIYTDGAARGNPGPGGYGTVLLFSDNGAILSRKEFAEGFRLTTNNRMELLALIIGLEALKSQQFPVLIFSDSKYVVDSITKNWVLGWVKTGFKGKKNKDLWLRYLAASKGFNLEIRWVKGHNGHPLNERCDQLAVEASLRKVQFIDEGYEAQQKEDTGLGL